MAIIDDENLSLYAEESLEHLETIESDLLEIEKAGENIDEDLVNKVFRAAHSIKGGGGFFGLDNIKELSHKIENVLDMVRHFELEPTPEIVNIVLKAFDRLGELLNDLMNSNDMEIEEHINTLTEIVTGSVDNSEKETILEKKEVSIEGKGPVFKISQLDMDLARKGGKDIYLLSFDLINDIQAQGKTPLDLISTLADIGTLLEAVLDIDKVGDLDNDDFGSSLPWCILFASVVEADLLGVMVGLDSSKITLLPKGEESSSDIIDIQDGEVEVKTEKEEVKTEKEEVKTTKKEVKAKKADKEPAAAKSGAIKKAPAKKPASTAEQKAPTRSESLRVAVNVLDKLMNRAGEMVLARNELLLAITGDDKKAVTNAAQRINLVTLELQESIMATRMQPVGAIFNKFNRVVRDMSRDLEKNMVLKITGSEIELDKTIIEGLGDPLTHLVRNSCDHGIEDAEARVLKGKPEKGTISLKAFHESGQVLIEIEDDGKGLDPEKLAEKAISKGMITVDQAEAMSDNEKSNLIMLPGFSTMDEVSEISGRGVGMDVVKTNLDQMGGHVDLVSEVDKGTTIRIKLPLTLAIMPSLLVEASEERFAIPQVSVRELLRIPASEIREKIDKVGGSDVLILRGELIPLMQLNNVMDLSQTYYDQKTGIFRPDRREGLSDIRISDKPLSSKTGDDNKPAERRSEFASDVSIVILQAGAFRFGLVVEKVHDTIEIVVKPLGRHLKSCGIYAGATLLGDGHVALILDVAGLGQSAKLSTDESQSANKNADEVSDVAGEKDVIHQNLLLFHNGPEESFAVPLHLVLRIERIKTTKIRISGGKKVILYRGGNLPVFALEEVANVE
ncbi:MAG: chemotaxis protein CheA, partial [Proteobacteria bacterium]|nr:chemotaxis protein CheA [Pseudomonadota bacterium]